MLFSLKIMNSLMINENKVVVFYVSVCTCKINFVKNKKIFYSNMNL